MRAKRLRQQCLAAARGANQQNIGFGQFDVAAFLRVVEPLVMVVHSNGQDTLGCHLTNHIVIQEPRKYLWALARHRSISGQMLSSLHG